MAASKTEQILEAIKVGLETVPGAKVERNTVVREKIPAGSFIVLRDGDPGEPDTALGGFASVYYRHAVELELYAGSGDQTVRDQIFDDLATAVGATLARIFHEGR